MSVTKKVALAAAILAVAAVAIGRLAISGWSRPNVTQPMSIRGAIVEQSADPAKQLPISDVEVTAENNLVVSGTSSDNSGFFSLSLRPEIRPGTPVLLKFRNADFKPLALASRDPDFTSSDLTVSREGTKSLMQLRRNESPLFGQFFEVVAPVLMMPTNSSQPCVR